MKTKSPVEAPAFLKTARHLYGGHFAVKSETEVEAVRAFVAAKRRR